MGIHSTWTTAGLKFYQTGTTYTAFIIPVASHPFAFGEQGQGFDIYLYGDTTGSYGIWDQAGNRLNLYYADLNIYGASGTEVVYFDSSEDVIDLTGWNIINDHIRTDTTGVGTTGVVTLTKKSPKFQFLAPTSAAGDTMIKLPAASDSAGMDFVLYNGFSTGMGVAPGYNLIVVTTGMGASTGTIINTLVMGQTAHYYCDGLNWRGLVESS